MREIAALLARALRERGDQAAQVAVRSRVTELCAAFPPYPSGGRGA